MRGGILSTMRFFSSPKKTTELFFDLDSGSLGVLLLRRESSELPTVLFSSRYSFPFTGLFSGKNLYRKLGSLLEHAFADVHPHLGSSPDEITFFLAPPFSVEHVRRAQKDFAPSIILTETNVRMLLDELVVNYKKEIRDTLLDLLPEEEPYLVEQKVVASAVNGYATNTPFGALASSFNADLFLAAMSSAHHAFIRDNLAKRYPRVPISFASRAASLGETIRSVISTPDLIMVDVGDHQTEITVVRDGMIAQAGTFPLGTHAVIRPLSHELGLPREVALSALSLDAHSVIHADERLRMADALGRVRKNLLAQFQKLLVPLATLSLVPDTILLFVPPLYRSFYTTFLSDDLLAPYNLKNKAFTVFSSDDIPLETAYRFGKDVPRDRILLWEVGVIH
jgi:hypothetical protein